tara:strand:+ start:417 stop:1412 length:996 start_codon:yes stop_codon:yes gene_type:complete
VGSQTNDYFSRVLLDTAGLKVVYHFSNIILNKEGLSNYREKVVLEHDAKEIQRETVEKNTGLLSKAKNFFIKNGRYLFSLIPVFFYGICLLADGITTALATVTAVSIAGGVSLIVLHENKKIEELKLEEKWIFDVRKKLYEFSHSADSFLDQCVRRTRECVDLPEMLSMDDEKNMHEELIKHREHIKYVLDECVLDNPLADRMGNSLTEVGLMLRSFPRGENEYKFTVMFSTILQNSIFLICHTNTKRIGHPFAYFSFLRARGVPELVNGVNVFLDAELRRSKKGSSSLRRNIKACYAFSVSCALSFAIYVVVKALLDDGGAIFYSHSTWL